MNPLAALAIIDAAITTYGRAMQLLDNLRAEGVITAEQQAARMGEVAVSRALAGLPPAGEPGNSPG